MSPSRSHASRRARTALAVTAVLLASGGLVTASAVDAPTPATTSTFVPITPCRLFDTRPGSDNVGPRATPIGNGETLRVQVTGTNGRCTIPAGATGVALNVTVVSPTAASFLTIFPSDQAMPTAASLNWVAGQAPTPNGVTTALSTDGRASFFNFAGTVQVITDVVGYHVPIATVVPIPARVVWVATNGTHPAAPGGKVAVFASVREALASITDDDAAHPYVVKIAPGTYDEPGGVDLKDFVDLEGLGQDVTTITCACGAGTDGSPGHSGKSATLRVGQVTASGGTSGSTLHGEIRQLTVSNRGTGTYATAVWTGSQDPGAIRFAGVTATVSGGVGNYAIWNQASSPFFVDVTAVATGSPTSSETFGVTLAGTAYDHYSGFALDRVTIKATGGTSAIGVRLADVYARARAIDADVDGAASSIGFVLIGGFLQVDNSRILGFSSAFDISGLSSILDVKGSTLVTVGPSVNLANGTVARITGSTLSQSAAGSGTFGCSFNSNIGGTEFTLGAGSHPNC